MEIQLRVVLLGVGLLILLVVAYDFFKRKSTAGNSEPLEPNFKHSNIYEHVEPEMYSAPMHTHTVVPENSFVESADVEQYNLDSEAYMDYAEISDSKSDDTSHIITLTIMARDQYGFEGADLLAALAGANLEFGKNDMFHRYEGDESIFCVVNAMEPGYFILETLPNEHISGITLILLPDRVADPCLAFDKLIRATKQIAFALNGEMLDHFKLPLTLETIEQYRREVEAVTKRKN